MKTIMVVTGILKCNNEFLAVKRSEEDDKFPGFWEFPGGHVENNETLKEALQRELKEEIGFDKEFESKITNYAEEINNNIHHIEFDFIIEVDKKDVNVTLSSEHIDYKWLTKDSKLLDNFIRKKLKNL